MIKSFLHKPTTVVLFYYFCNQCTTHPPTCAPNNQSINYPLSPKVHHRSSIIALRAGALSLSLLLFRLFLLFLLLFSLFLCDVITTSHVDEKQMPKSAHSFLFQFTFDRPPIMHSSSPVRSHRASYHDPTHHHPSIIDPVRVRPGRTVVVRKNNRRKKDVYFLPPNDNNRTTGKDRM